MKKNYTVLFFALMMLISFSLRAETGSLKSFSGSALESFNYGVGESLIGQTAPEGFSGEWFMSSSDWDGTATIVEESLSYPGFPSTAGALYIETGSNETVLECLYNDSVFTANTTVWASMLFKSDNDLSGDGQVWFQPSGGIGDGVLEQLGFGYHWTPNFKSSGCWDPQFYGPEIMGGVTYLLMAKYVISADGSTEATFWVDPPLDSEPQPEDAFYSTLISGVHPTDYLAVWAGYGNSGITLDELRVSTESYMTMDFSGTANESFDYAIGASLIGQTAPEGFQGEWFSTTPEWDGSATIVEDGLLYPGFFSEAGALYMQTGSNETVLECLYDGNVFTPNTTYWASMLFKSDNDLTGDGQLWLQAPGGVGNGPKEQLGIGYHWAASFKSTGNWDPQFYGPEIMGGITYLLMAKYIVDADGTVEATFWVDPPLDEEPTAETAFYTTSVNEVTPSDYIALWAGYGNSGITIDEIRVSTESYMDPPTAVGEIINQKPDFNFYPNPANDMITLSQLENVTSVNIVNLMGQVVLTLDDIQKESFSVNISDLEPGLYFVSVLNIDGKYSTRKLLKK